MDGWRIEALSRWAAIPAVVLSLVLIALAGRYGLHRDELYFVESMKHPAWGFVDNPSSTPAAGWLSRWLFGDSIRGLRVLPAVEAATIVAVVALIAKELGGRPQTQLQWPRRPHRSSWPPATWRPRQPSMCSLPVW